MESKLLLKLRKNSEDLLLVIKMAYETSNVTNFINLLLVNELDTATNEYEATNLSVLRSPIDGNGEGIANIVEPSVLSVSRAYGTIWKKESLDLTELARKRWIEKWTVDRIAHHFGWGRTAVVRYLRRLRAKGFDLDVCGLANIGRRPLLKVRPRKCNQWA